MSRLSLYTLLTLAMVCMMNDSTNADEDCSLNFKMKNIDGKTVDLEDYEGKVVLIVNVASECGATPQYAGLQDLYTKYKDQGFVVLGFPCNQFNAQEPGTSAEIKSFCSKNYGVSFPMFAKVEVKGTEACPLYKKLTSQDSKPKGKGNVSWNFEKFLIDADGHLAARYGTQTEPADAELVKKIESLLKK